jgi:hypothetical protein
LQIASLRSVRNDRKEKTAPVIARIPNDEVDRETRQSAKTVLPQERLVLQIASLRSVRNDRKEKKRIRHCNTQIEELH